MFVKKDPWGKFGRGSYGDKCILHFPQAREFTDMGSVFILFHISHKSHPKFFELFEDWLREDCGPKFHISQAYYTHACNFFFQDFLFSQLDAKTFVKSSNTGFPVKNFKTAKSVFTPAEGKSRLPQELLIFCFEMQFKSFEFLNNYNHFFSTNRLDLASVLKWDVPTRTLYLSKALSISLVVFMHLYNKK